MAATTMTAWTHRDLLRLSHPQTSDPSRKSLFDWICKGTVPSESTDGLELINDFTDAQRATTAAQWVDIIARGHGLSWEMLPDAALGHAEVWEALLTKGIPQTALMRQLPRLTRLGLTTGETGRRIVADLIDPQRLKRARVHPINVLVALRTYASGRSARGDSTWVPSAPISDALDAAFYNAFGAVEPSGKRTLLALDVSRSMTTSSVSGLPLTCREASAALAMATAKVEHDYEIVGFTGDGRFANSTAIERLDISPRRRLDDICHYIDRLGFGATDCALPMIWALKNKIPVDCFHIYTDNETWYGSIHPHQALREYREKMGIPARLVVVAMTATGRSIADPKDPGQLDVSGFDSAVPQLLSSFTRGDI